MNTLENNEGMLSSLFKYGKQLKVPSYQRAYAWQEKQLEQFVTDMLEMIESGNYYYGHFILEELDDCYEIIDGQQRITTFILFLMVCHLHADEKTKAEIDFYIRKFETVDYDNDAFKTIQSKINQVKHEWTVENLDLATNPTLSLKRIIDALNYFYKLFQNKSTGICLDKNSMNDYLETLLQAHISTHNTRDKSVAVQIFELHNTRGIELSLMDRFKSKLMKAVYVNSEYGERDNIINEIQNRFAEIFRLEELASSNSFRGDLSLAEILLYHLRVVDAGQKLNADDKRMFNNPSKSGKRDEIILNYIQENINKTEKSEVVTYIQNLVSKFATSVKLVCENLPKKDENNHLIGDVLIIDRIRSLEFFILLHHKLGDEFKLSAELIQRWEKFLYTRDFHDKYYGLQYRDDFEGLYLKLIQKLKEGDTNNKGDVILSVLNGYLVEGFRPDIIRENLLDVVSNYIENNRDNILNRAFNWWKEKMVYLLYKYEIHQLNKNYEFNNSVLSQLRAIIKNSYSVEHILPQSWQWEWINETSEVKSETGKQLNEKIQNVINGIGNLLLITSSDNSSLGNTHPKEKTYHPEALPSYKKHNHTRLEWANYNDWDNKITTRGEEIICFLKTFVKE